MRVNIEDVLRLKQERAKLNSIPLQDIEWYKNGVKIEVPPVDIEDFAFTGLSNIDFIDEDGNTFSWEHK